MQNVHNACILLKNRLTWLFKVAIDLKSAKKKNKIHQEDILSYYSTTNLCEKCPKSKWLSQFCMFVEKHLTDTRGRMVFSQCFMLRAVIRRMSDCLLIASMWNWGIEEIAPHPEVLISQAKLCTGHSFFEGRPISYIHKRCLGLLALLALISLIPIQINSGQSWLITVVSSPSVRWQCKLNLQRPRAISLSSPHQRSRRLCRPSLSGLRHTVVRPRKCRQKDRQWWAPPNLDPAKCHKTHDEAIILVAADLAKMLPPVTFFLTSCWCRRFKSSCAGFFHIFPASHPERPPSLFPLSKRDRQTHKQNTP